MASPTTTLRAIAIVILFGTLWAKALGITEFADPAFIDWMIEGDWMGHLFGWLFARNAEWALPLAGAPDLVAPTGSSAALTDAIPILTVFGKLLSPFFGERMQLFGLWMVAGVIGTGIAGVLVCRAWLADLPSLALAGCLFVMNPIVSTRWGHPPFFAFWMLSGLVGACLWPIVDLRNARRIAGVTLVLGFLACATNAYLAIMGSLLVGASIARLALSRVFKPGEALGWLLAGPVTALASLWLFGFITGARASPMGTLAIEGFGQFSADLLALVNPLKWSRFIPAIPTSHRQYEGFSYLGLGVLLLLGLRLALLVKYRPSRREVLLAIPLLLACGVAAFYSLSNIVTVAGQPVANLSSFYAQLGPWPSVFRSSGRFIWPLFAWLTMIAALATARIPTTWVRQAVLGAAVLVQFVDFNATLTGLRREYPVFEPLKDPAWQLIGQGYQHVVVHPVQIQWTCPFDGKLIAQLSWEAYRQKLTINSGHVGRPPPGTDCNRHLPASELDPQTIYVPYFQQFYADFLVPQLACAPLDGRLVCVSRSNDTPLLRALLSRSGAR